MHLLGDAVLAVGELHAAAQNGGFVHGQHDGVGGNAGNLWIAHEIVDDILQFEGIVFFTLRLEILFEHQELFFQLGAHHEEVVSHVVDVLPTLPSDGQ